MDNLLVAYLRKTSDNITFKNDQARYPSGTPNGGQFAPGRNNDIIKSMQVQGHLNPKSKTEDIHRVLTNAMQSGNTHENAVAALQQLQAAGHTAPGQTYTKSKIIRGGHWAPSPAANPRDALRTRLHNAARTEFVQAHGVTPKPILGETPIQPAVKG